MNQKDLLISVCGALFGHVTPNLRALYVVLDDEVTRLMFYYDTPLSELEVELVSLTDTEFLADFPNDKTDFELIVLPYPAKIPQSGLCVYFLSDMRWSYFYFTYNKIFLLSYSALNQ